MAKVDPTSTGRHVIVTTENGQQVRLSGVFTDAEFFALPFVKQTGSTPSGTHAGHFGIESSHQRDHYLALPESARDARTVLAACWEAAQERKYAVTTVTAGRDSESSVYYRTQADARAAMATAVQNWRRVDRVGERVGLGGGTYGVWRQHGTAIRRDDARHASSMRDVVESVGWYELRRRMHGHTGTVAFLYVRAVDARSVEVSAAVRSMATAVA